MVIPEDLTDDTLVLTTTGTKKFGDLLPTDILIDEQYIANQLLEQGKEVIKTVSQPSFQFSVDSTNFLFSEKFLPFIKQIELGCIINIEIEEGNWAYPCLLEMVIDYDNASLDLTFSNRFRQSSEEWTFAELHNEQVKTTTQVGSTLQIAAEPVLNGTINQVREYMNNNLIAANQQIQSTVDNEITIGNFGLRGRKKDDSYSSGYDPHQLWINNNLIVMTDDNWETTKLAIGFINDTYSVNAEVIAGTILAGENLIISNTGGTFTVDGKGATMTNGSISTQLRDSNGNIASEIVLNPEQGFSISNMKSSDSDKRVFYADTQGNLHFKGDLTGATGSFSGELKAATGTFSGSLSAATGTFSGNLSAAGGTFTGTLVGVDGTFSGTLSASQIKGGTLSGTSINIGDGNFVVDNSGNLTANDGTFNGTISGEIASNGSIAANNGISFTGNVGINMEPGNLANGLSVNGWRGNSNYCIFAQQGIYAYGEIHTDEAERGVSALAFTLNGKTINEWEDLVAWDGPLNISEAVQLALMNLGGTSDYVSVLSPSQTKYQLNFHYGLCTSIRDQGGWNIGDFS